ncbi:MAG: uroporphyrinogen decarboxylase family protein [Sedimentisphaerales bacterium]
MNSKERVCIAMTGGIPDRVPVIPQICHPHAIKALGLDYRKTIIECLRNPLLINELDLKCVKMYGVDGIRLWVPPDPVTAIEDDGNDVWQIDEKTGRRIGRIDFMGGGWIEPLEETPSIETLEDVERLEVIPADVLVKTEKFKSLKKITDENCENLFVIGGVPAFSFEYVTILRGKQQALMDIIEKPDFVKAIIDRGLQISIEVSIAFAKIGIDALYIGETYGGLIGPRLFEEFCMPAFTAFVKALKPYGILTYLHVCGNSTQLLELMADTGVDCIEPLDPLGGVSVADAKKRVGNRIALMGGINTTLLAHGSLDDVVADYRRCLDGGAPGGGYILAAGDMLPTETSKEKVEAMIKVAHSYKY